jgi:hypothetical protein
VEALELSAVQALLAALATRFAIDPLIELSTDMRDVYPASHWAVVGQPPRYARPTRTYSPGGTSSCSAAGVIARLPVSPPVLGTST